MKPSLKSIYFFIGYAFFTNFLSMHASSPTLAALVKASTGVARIPNDVGDYMHNYVTQHFSPAGTRLSSCCNMKKATFSGTSADSGVVLGVENNTGLDFLVMQNSVIIDVLKPGMNDVALHLASLISSTGTTSVTSDITFVPKSGAQSSQVRLRVLTGAQLFTHMKNISTAQGVAFLKNGTNSVAGVGQLAATSSDQYLVVETVSTDSSMPLNVAEQRIQVLNLTNITNIYTLILEINLMGLVFEPKGTVSNGSASTVDKVSEYPSLNDTYLVSIKNVHILNEVSAHVVPLLVLPRNILQSGTSLNLPYATYIQSYSNYIAGKNAGAAKEYYDLMINYVCEPYGYLNALHYFDVDKFLLAVVDQSANLASGKVLDSVIGTDVYATSLALSSDLSLVYTAQDANGNAILDPGYEYLTLGFDIDSMKQKVLSSNPYDVVTPGVFPSNPVSTAFFNNMWGDQKQIAIHMLNWGGNVYDGGIMAGNVTALTPGVSYNDVGSFSSSFFTLQTEDWQTYGLHFVPVYYSASTMTPIITKGGLSIVSSEVLYFYVFKIRDGKFIGLIPVLTSGQPNMLVGQEFTNVIQFFRGVYSLWQSGSYSSYVRAKFNGPDLVASNQNPPHLDYPGDCILNWDGQYFRGLRNLVKDVSEFAPYVEKAWSIDNGDGSDKWMISVPKSAIKNGIDIHVSLLSNQNYEMVLRDNQQNILGFKQFTTSQVDPTLMINHISSSGAVDWFNTPTQLLGAKNIFNVKGSGNTLTAVKTAAPVAVVPVKSPAAMDSSSVPLPSGITISSFNFYPIVGGDANSLLSVSPANLALIPANASFVLALNLVKNTTGGYDASVSAYLAGKPTPLFTQSYPSIVVYEGTKPTATVFSNAYGWNDTTFSYTLSNGTTTIGSPIDLNPKNKTSTSVVGNKITAVSFNVSAASSKAADKKDKKHDKKDKKHDKPAKEKTKAEIKAKIAKLQAEESAAA